MNDKDYKIFPTLVRQVDDFISQQECKVIQQEILQHSLKDKHNLLTGDSVSSHLKSNILDILSIDLNERIKEVAKRYTEYSGLHNKNNITTSWFNIQKKDSVLLEHTHPNSVLSGVIYTNVDENSSALYFYNPNPFITFMENERDKDFSFEWFYIKPKLCSLLIFPSWLRHGSNRIKNQTEDRTVISFNIR
jgi:uncharacterized protein (TIGR02466 family)